MSDSDWLSNALQLVMIILFCLLLYFYKIRKMTYLGVILLLEALLGE